MKTIFENISSFVTLMGDFTKPEGEVSLVGGNFVYTDENFRITSVTETHHTGVKVRRDRVENISGRDITLTSALSKFVYNGGEYEVLTQYNEWCGESDGKWTELVNEISASVDETRLNMSASPFVALRSLQSGRGTVFHIMANSCWEYRVKRWFAQAGLQKTVFVELGINSRNFSYTLKSGEALDMPEIIYYDFKNRLDLDAYKLHRYWNAAHPAKALPVVYNTWMACFDEINFDYISKQLDIATDLGAEYFVIDAGWFGPLRKWSSSVGDWREHPDSELRGRMLEFSDKIRGKGLKFGLWFEFERAALDSESYKAHPEYYIADHGMGFVDFSKPEAVEYIFGVVSGMIEKYGIEYIKSDYNGAPYLDTSRHAFLDYFKGYSMLVKRLREKHPSLYLECCASGGGRLGLYALSDFNSCWMSDNHSLYTQLEIYKNTLIRMPSRTLETWITIANTKGFREDLKDVYGKGEKTLASGDATWNHVESVADSFLGEVIKGGLFGISCDLCDVNENTRALLRQSIAEFKVEREFWANSEARILTDTDSILVLQHNDANFTKIKISVFVKVPHQTGITIYPVLSEGDYRYGNTTLTAKEIDEDGITIPVDTRYTASGFELVKIK